MNQRLLLLVVTVIAIVVIITIFNRRYKTEEERNANRGKLWLAIVITLVIAFIAPMFITLGDGKEYGYCYHPWWAFWNPWYTECTSDWGYGRNRDWGGRSGGPPRGDGGSRGSGGGSHGGSHGSGGGSHGSGGGSHGGGH